jgi:hypothetical protein
MDQENRTTASTEISCRFADRGAGVGGAVAKTVPMVFRKEDTVARTGSITEGQGRVDSAEDRTAGFEAREAW